MTQNIKDIQNIYDLIRYFSGNLGWDIDMDSFDDIEDLTYDFDASDLGLKEEAFAKIASLRQLRSLVDEQEWGIFCVEFDSNRFEVSALRKILSSLVPRRRRSVDHKVWDKHDLLFLCNWGQDNNRTIGIAHFEDKEDGLPQIKMISCQPAVEDQTQLNTFEERLSLLRWPKDTGNVQAWRVNWASAFKTAYRETINTAHNLTIQLAAEAQGIRDRILETLSIEADNGYVHLLYEKFRETLVHDLSESDFADMYAQTIVYGLFSARCMDETQENFTVQEAIECIPNTNPFLKSLMAECVGVEKNSALSFDELEIDNVVELLRHTNTTEIIKDFNRQTGGGKEDPVIHFYEEFLTAYNKQQKVQRGVYYTPQPVVNFIVRAVDTILKDEFGYKDGLATTATKKIKTTKKSNRLVNGVYKEIEVEEEVPAVQILDPAVGTGTFLRQVILQIYNNFRESHKGESEEQIRAAWNKYVPEHLLPRINGFELMMAPYAVSHMKLAMVLKDTGYDFVDTPRLRVYLTNSLEEPKKSEDQFSLFEEDPLANESVEANNVKTNPGINILIGNPPYSTESSNKGKWIDSLMETYKTEADGKTKLREKNSKPINDDYIKFIRYAQSIIENRDNGILSFINPHGFLDGPIFRGMRSSLMREFNKIYILDLHGNANRQEATPEGGKDENVFDIKQGVCILIAIRQKLLQNNSKPLILRADLWGNREGKYSILSSSHFSDISWQIIEPEVPMNMFFVENNEKKAAYEDGFSIRNLFKINGTGILTKRDSLCIHFTPEDAFSSAKSLLTEPKSVVVSKYNIPEDVRDWKYDWAKEDLVNHGLHIENVRKIAYRPFDLRYTYYTGQSRGFMGWPVHAVMQHIINTNNVALVTARSNKTGNSTHFFVSSSLVEYKCGERTTNSSVFPLYSMPDGCFSRKANFDQAEIIKIERHLGINYTEEDEPADNAFNAFDLFSYIYAILYSTRYRALNKDFLNRDFPIIPYPTLKVFNSLTSLGASLINAHLLNERHELTNLVFVGEDFEINKVIYENGKIMINKTSYFACIPKNVWDYIIGGYQPCHRWLKERKGRTLSVDDINHYISIIGAIYFTINQSEKIDLITNELF